MILKLIFFRLRGALDTINNNNITLSCQNILYTHIDVTLFNKKSVGYNCIKIYESFKK